MTEIVDDRQRLTEDDIREAIVATMTFREALAELAPSGVPVDKLAAFYRRAAAAEIVRAWLARPQEQPRKAWEASEAMVDAAVDTFNSIRGFPRFGEPINRLWMLNAVNAALRLSVSPAAAQGWQMVPDITGPDKGGRFWLHFRSGGMRGGISFDEKNNSVAHIIRAWRDDLIRALAAVPPSPADLAPVTDGQP